MTDPAAPTQAPSAADLVMRYFVAAGGTGCTALQLGGALKNLDASEIHRALIGLVERGKLEAASVTGSPETYYFPRDAGTAVVPQVETGAISEVFLAFGHDRSAMLEVQLLLGQIGLEIQVLRDRIRAGESFLQALIRLGRNSDAAIVLLTGDDVVDSELSSERRARQNVILEVGYFISRLGLSRVVILKEIGVELPSYLDGLHVLEFRKESIRTDLFEGLMRTLREMQ